jgi:DNA-binding NarL/FixJ family response regulator
MRSRSKAKLPDIVLLDVSLPGGGMEAARAIVKACPVVKIIMLTVSESEEHVQQAMAAGVHGYVLKGTSGPELINTLRAVARGEYYVTPTFAARILAHTRRPPKAPPRDDGNGDLTKREEQILNRVADGLTNKEIAGALQISEKTVKHYMTNILQKLQVRNRVEAAMEYRKMNVIARRPRASARPRPARWPRPRRSGPRRWRRAWRPSALVEGDVGRDSGMAPRYSSDLTR